MHVDGRCTWSGCQCPGLLTSLSEREIEVLYRLASGEGVKVAAEGLNISIATVNAHKYNMFRKTGATSIIELVLGAVRSGLISVNQLPELGARVQSHH